MSKDTDRPATESTALVRLDPQALLVLAVQNNAGIDTMERLVALAKTVREQDAKEAWHRAIARFQSDCPAILKTGRAKIATKTGGSYSYTYAPLAEIMEKIQPAMGQYGLSVSFRMRFADDRVFATCLVAHEMGHTESSGEVGMPIEKYDGTGANPAQRVGIAASYAKRQAVTAILGIAPQDDEDGASEADRKPSVEMPRRASEAATETTAEPADGPGPTTKQVSRLWAIAFGGGKKLKIGEDAVKSKVNALLGLNGATTVSELSRDGYEAVCKKLEEWGQGGE